MLKKLLTVAAVAAGLSQGAAQAETCGGVYKVKRGDSLSLIADQHYKNAGMWTAIHQNNLKAIGKNPASIRVGMKLRLTCINGLPTGLTGGTDVTAAAATAAPVVVAPGTAASRKKISILVADEYKPFMDRSLPNGGLVIDVMQQVMKTAAPAEGFAFHWVNDFSAHLEPLLSNALLDVGVPWLRPACESTPDVYRCKNFDFSEPMFEMLILLFTNKNKPIAFNSDADIVGLNLCRPAGYYTHDLDKGGRNWVSQSKITLTRPDSVNDCFELLGEGKVDAVVINEFTGRAAIKELNMKDVVKIIDTRPLSIEGLHVLVHKTHPRGKELIATINAGLKKIKETGQYQKIIDVHMTRIWSDF
ncbi:MAG TPA: peptidoglycan-binding protein LysM [Rhodobacteraceae bacterium]|nr:peptidoglycan-binding protein LysM [Paracoccaceae bacterium]